MFELEKQVLQKMAIRTKVQYETLSECFGLDQQHLLFSDDYSNIILPIFNNTSISGVLNDITLIYYLRSKYKKSNIFIVVKNKHDILNGIYDLFDNIYTQKFVCKKYLDLIDISKQINTTKFVYNKSLEFYTDIDTYCKDGIRINEQKILQPILKGNIFPDTYKICVSTKYKNISDVMKISDIQMIFSSGELNDVYFLHDQNNMINDLYFMSQCLLYINIGNDSIYDYLAPYMNLNIRFKNTGLYSEYINKIFKYSCSNVNKKIERLNSTKILGV